MYIMSKQECVQSCNKNGALVPIFIRNESDTYIIDQCSQKKRQNICLYVNLHGNDEFDISIK